jgi:hypothetical protein
MNRGVRGCVFTICATAILFSLTGCAGRVEKPRVPNVIAVPAPDGKTGNYTLENYRDDLSAYSKASGPEAVRLRNKMVYGIAAEIDFVFFDYETKLFLNEGRFHVGSDFIQLGLAAGSTITNPARAKTVLSAALTGVTGLSLSIDKNYFRQQTVQSIMSSMEANRDRIKTIILQQLLQDTTTYPFEAARSDLIKYFFAGTLAGGLQQLSQQAATNAEIQKTNLNQEQVKNISAADLKSVTDLNQAIAKTFAGTDLSKVKAWLKAMGIAVEESTTKDQLETEIRELGRKTTTDEALRKKYFEEAKKAGLIQ